MSETLLKKLFITGISGGIVYLLGGWDIILQVLVTMVIIDYATGFLKAFINKQLSSQIGFKGIVKKIFIFVMVMVAVEVEKVVGIPSLNVGGLTLDLHSVVCVFYISNEAISILENAVDSGLKIPSFLKTLLLKISDETDRAAGVEIPAVHNKGEGV